MELSTGAGDSVRLVREAGTGTGFWASAALVFRQLPDEVISSAPAGYTIPTTSPADHSREPCKTRWTNLVMSSDCRTSIHQPHR